jgi:hypothetical protein
MYLPSMIHVYTICSKAAISRPNVFNIQIYPSTLYTHSLSTCQSLLILQNQKSVATATATGMCQTLKRCCQAHVPVSSQKKERETTHRPAIYKAKKSSPKAARKAPGGQAVRRTARALRHRSHDCPSNQVLSRWVQATALPVQALWVPWKQEGRDLSRVIFVTSSKLAYIPVGSQSSLTRSTQSSLYL